MERPEQQDPLEPAREVQYEGEGHAAAPANVSSVTAAYGAMQQPQPQIVYGIDQVAVVHGGEPHIQQPLLPPDGPLLAQHHPHHPHLPQEMGEQQGMQAMTSFDVQLQHWINFFGGQSSGSQIPAILMPTALNQQHLADSTAAKSPESLDYRASSAFQGTGAFAPLRPMQAGEGDDKAVGAAIQQQQVEHPWGLPVQPLVHIEHQMAGGEGLQATQPYAHAYREQEELRGEGEAAPVTQQPNFEHLVEHAAAQRGQGDSAAQQQAPIRPQAHKPPQATKSSRFRGVYRRQRGGRWEASIVLDGKNCRLGLHLTELAAARAYDRVAIKKWGPEAASDKINFPVTQYDLAELAAMEMGELVATVRAEWRTKEGKAAGNDNAPDYSSDQITPPEEQAAKRQRLEDGSALDSAQGRNAGQMPIVERPEDEQETLERVPMARSSAYRGVSTHKQSGKWVAQIKSGGKQVYLGFYTDQEDAARAYDQAAINLQGEAADTNFPIEQYADRYQQLQEIALADLVSALKQHGRGGAPRQPKSESSKYRGVAPDKSRKWRAQITTGAKQTVYLGLWAVEEAAARAYDRANIARRGEAAKTNFPLAEYAAEVEQLRTMTFENLVSQLRAEAVASVVADKAARREVAAASLAPLPQIEEMHARGQYLAADGQYPQGVPAEALQYGQGAAFPLGQPGKPGGGSMASGYLLSRQGSQSRPDLLFRVTRDRRPEEEAPDQHV